MGIQLGQQHQKDARPQQNQAAHMKDLEKQQRCQREKEKNYAKKEHHTAQTRLPNFHENLLSWDKNITCISGCR